MAHRHWVSEFNRDEIPHVTTEVREATDSSSKVLVKHRHATTVAWNAKSYNNNNDNAPCRPSVTALPASPHDRCTSSAYLYVRNRDGCEHQCDSACGGNPCHYQKHQHHCHSRSEKHYVEIKETVRDCRDNCRPKKQICLN